MKKSLFAIALLFSFMGVVIHEIIPHHHHFVNETGFYSNPNYQTDKPDNHNDCHLPFTNHQQLFSTESFNITRTNLNFLKDISFLGSCYIITNQLRLELHKPYLQEKIIESSVSLHFTIFATPNSMRGSPLIA